jgi:hypothetical protein
MVYLGVDAPVAGYGEVGLGEVGLDPDVRTKPAALAGKAWVYRVADRVESGWNCSCIFLDDALPWEDPDAKDDEETLRRRAAYAGLRQIAGAALARDPEAQIFSCWSGDEIQPPKIERCIGPEALLADRYLFDEVYYDGGSGGNPPVLIRLRAGEESDVP